MIENYWEYVRNMGGQRKAVLDYLHGRMTPDAEKEFGMRSQPGALQAFAIAELAEVLSHAFGEEGKFNH